MITEKFKERINYLKNNHLIVEALYEILDELKLNHSAFTGFTFREEIDPKGFLLTAEGEEKLELLFGFHVTFWILIWYYFLTF
ncbi:MAG TPA: hypothetical protein DEQ26_11540 [Flavobacteriaceae bacterium]|nr:hypothetical protein [Flavobacteriaceae bacterium]